jgi:hypothetical protein
MANKWKAVALAATLVRCGGKWRYPVANPGDEVASKILNGVNTTTFGQKKI